MEPGSGILRAAEVSRAAAAADGTASQGLRAAAAPDGQQAASAAPSDAVQDAALDETRCGFPSCMVEATKRCTGCKVAFYCSPEHQRGHWKAHKPECRRRRGKTKAAEAAAPVMAAGAADRAGTETVVEVDNAGEGGASSGGAAGGAANDGAGQQANGLEADKREVSFFAPEGNDPEVRGGRDNHGCSYATEGTTTQDRYVALQVHMQLLGDRFNSMTTPCGPRKKRSLEYALGVGNDEPFDKNAVNLVLGEEDMDPNVSNYTPPCTHVMRECIRGRYRNVELLLADGRIDPDQPSEAGFFPLYAAAQFGWPRCLKLLLADGRADPNQVDSEGSTPLVAAVNFGHHRCVELLLAEPRVNPNGDSSIIRQVPVFQAARKGNERCLALLLADPRVDPNKMNSGDHRGFTSLYVAAHGGMARCVERLLADERVDPNLFSSGGNGETPLSNAASEGRNQCVEMFLADERVDACRAIVSGRFQGKTPLMSACIPLKKSMDQVGAAQCSDPTRTLVLMLKSRRITKHSLEESIAHMLPCMPTQRQIDIAEAGGEPLHDYHKTTALVLPILRAQLKGEFRWCAHCLQLTPDVDLNRCGGCNQVGYCEEAPPGQKPCHVAHWAAGHKKDCKRFQAEAKAVADAAAAVAAAEAEAMEATNAAEAAEREAMAEEKRAREDPNTRTCSRCRRHLCSDAFSKNQWKKGGATRACENCKSASS